LHLTWKGKYKYIIVLWYQTLHFSSFISYCS